MQKIFKVALFLMLISSFSFSKEVILKDVLDREAFVKQIVDLAMALSARTIRGNRF